jgi:hypothetical protein
LSFGRRVPPEPPSSARRESGEPGCVAPQAHPSFDPTSSFFPKWFVSPETGRFSGLTGRGSRVLIKTGRYPAGRRVRPKNRDSQEES